MCGDVARACGGPLARVAALGGFEAAGLAAGRRPEQCPTLRRTSAGSGATEVAVRLSFLGLAVVIESLGLARVDGVALAAGPADEPGPGAGRDRCPSHPDRARGHGPGRPREAPRLLGSGLGGGRFAYDGTPVSVAAQYAGPGAPRSAAPRCASCSSPLRRSRAPPSPVRVVASSDGGSGRIIETYTFTVEDISPPRLVGALATGAAPAPGVRQAGRRAPSRRCRSRRSDAGRPGGAVVACFPSGAFVDLALAEPLSPASTTC